jgi:hypothetical protein
MYVAEVEADLRNVDGWNLDELPGFQRSFDNENSTILSTFRFTNFDFQYSDLSL